MALCSPPRPAPTRKHVCVRALLFMVALCGWLHVSTPAAKAQSTLVRVTPLQASATPGGTVEVSVERRPNAVRVSVQDHGEGIPEEFRGHIFKRFAQADSSTTREKSGTGLGLSIAKAIVEKHGGSIAFETQVGRGTSFYFDLPILPPKKLDEKPIGTSGNAIDA